MKLHHACLPALVAGAILFAMPGTGVAAAPAHAVYTAHLHAMNTGTTRTPTTGEARFTVDGDKLTIDIKVHGAPPDTVHWQHFHGFVDGRQATCPAANADANHDGIVDLIETEKASGTTMVPFITDPASMDVAHGTYPKADAQGDYTYRETVSLKALDAAFDKAFPGGKLDLDKRVVYIHGVPTDTRLPSTVQSLGPIPAQTTLPIACGRIERVSSHASH
ncbi:MAG: hypothetical protein J0H27_07440 [Xanthomonadales bacterium]|nr:hypothetical protein [Xanthomonadales bacterium]